MTSCDSVETIVIEAVFFPSGGFRLEGELVYPEAATPRGIVVIANPHPLLGGDMRNNVVAGLSEGLAERGLAVLRFNYRGVGRSEGPRVDVAGNLARFWETSHVPDELDSHRDVEAAIDFLRRELPSHLPMAAAGYSFGCALLPLLPSRDHLDALVLIAPTVAKHDYDPYQAVHCPLLVVAPDDDFATDAVTVRDWFEQLPGPKQLVSTRRDNHFFRGHEAWLVEAAHSFLAARWS